MMNKLELLLKAAKFGISVLTILGVLSLVWISVNVMGLTEIQALIVMVALLITDKILGE